MIGKPLYEKNSSEVQSMFEEYRNLLQQFVDRSIGYDAGASMEIYQILRKSSHAEVWEYVVDAHMEWLDEIDDEVIDTWSILRNNIAEYYSLIFDGKHNSDIAYEATLIEFGEDYLKVLQKFPHFNDDVETLTRSIF